MKCMMPPFLPWSFCIISSACRFMSIAAFYNMAVAILAADYGQWLPQWRLKVHVGCALVKSIAIPPPQIGIFHKNRVILQLGNYQIKRQSACISQHIKNTERFIVLCAGELFSVDFQLSKCDAMLFMTNSTTGFLTVCFLSAESEPNEIWNVPWYNALNYHYSNMWAVQCEALPIMRKAKLTAAKKTKCLLFAGVSHWFDRQTCKFLCVAKYFPSEDPMSFVAV